MSDYLKKLLDKKDFSVAHALQAIETGEDPNTLNSAGNSLLHLLVSSHEPLNRDAIKKLVTLHNADIHIKNAREKTPLQCLIDQPGFSADEALFLVMIGGDPNTKDSKEEPLIHKIAQSFGSDIPLRNLVTKYKVDVNSLNPSKKTPLESLIEGSFWDLENAFTLINLGANPNSQGTRQNSLIRILMTQQYLTEQDKRLISKLVHDYKVDMNAEHPVTKKTPLQDLLDKGTASIERILFLIGCGANANTLASNGQNIIHKLILKNVTLSNETWTAIKKLVKEYNVDFNEKDSYGKTAFQYALDIGYSYYDLNLLLVHCGANPDTKSTTGNSILHRLMQEVGNKSEDIERFITLFPSMLLVKNSNNDTPFESAMRTLKNGFGHPANVIPVVKNAPDFINKLKTAFNSQSKNIAEINSIFTIVHQRKRNQSFELQGLIRNIAFEAFVESLESLDPKDKLARLKWARTQTIFKEHRSYSFFATIGRTNTVIQIDKMIGEVETQLDAAPAAKKK